MEINLSPLGVQINPQSTARLSPRLIIEAGTLKTLMTQKEFRGVHDLPFCYICGKTFGADDDIDHDHVPPKAAFDAADHNFPLKLAVHRRNCHASMNLDDEILGQLISLIHGKQPSTRNDKLKIELYEDAESGAVMASFNQRGIELLIRRWLGGFHAALYRSYLPGRTRFAIQTTFPSGTIQSGQFKEDQIKKQHYLFVECIKRNRAAQNLDKIISNNGKLIYECVWDQLSDESWGCIFSINLYDWIELGDVTNFRSRGCAGLYSLPNGLVPGGASVATKLKFRLEHTNAADPFST